MSQGQISLLIHGTAKILWKWDIPDSFYFVGENLYPANERQISVCFDHPWCQNTMQIPVMTDLLGGIPSGEHTNSNGKWPFIVDFPIKNGDFPLLFVSSPEGNPQHPLLPVQKTSVQKMRCVVAHVAKTSPQMKLETTPLFRLMNLHAPCFVVYILSLSCWHSRSEDSAPSQEAVGGFLMADRDSFFCRVLPTLYKGW